MSDLSQESPLWREWAESRHSVRQMREELERLRAELAVAQKDAGRLDWLKAHARPTVVRVGCVSFRIRLTREAIDAAMGGGNG